MRRRGPAPQLLRPRRLHPPASRAPHTRDGAGLLKVVTPSAAFYIYSAPVTNGQYLKFSHDTGNAAPEQARGADADAPVVNVTWHDADAYCQWADSTLPTEGEWMAAFRALGGPALGMHVTALGRLLGAKLGNAADGVVGRAALLSFSPVPLEWCADTVYPADRGAAFIAQAADALLAPGNPLSLLKPPRVICGAPFGEAKRLQFPPSATGDRLTFRPVVRL